MVLHVMLLSACSLFAELRLSLKQCASVSLEFMCLFCIVQEFDATGAQRRQSLSRKDLSPTLNSCCAVHQCLILQISGAFESPFLDSTHWMLPKSPAG